jgi:hypothetical protein
MEMQFGHRFARPLPMHTEVSRRTAPALLRWLHRDTVRISQHCHDPGWAWHASCCKSSV